MNANLILLFHCFYDGDFLGNVPITFENVALTDVAQKVALGESEAKNSSSLRRKATEARLQTITLWPLVAIPSDMEVDALLPPGLTRELLLRPVVTVKFNARALNVLMNAEITTIGQLILYSKYELGRVKNSGRLTVNHINHVLQGELKVKLGMNLDPRVILWIRHWSEVIKTQRV